MKHLVFVIPSYNRIEWLYDYVNDMYHNMIKPVNDMLKGDKLSMVIYVEGGTLDEFNKLFDATLYASEYIHLVYIVREKTNILDVRMKTLEDTLYVVEETMGATHILLGDDDWVIKDSEPLLWEFRSLFNSGHLDKEKAFTYIVPHATDKIIKCEVPLEEVHEKIIFLMRFQIFTVDVIKEILKADWYNPEIIKETKFAEDSIIGLFAMIAGASVYQYPGFANLIHIGIEDILLHPLHNNNKQSVQENLDYIKNLDFPFKDTGFNIGQAHSCDLIAKETKEKGTSVYHQYKALFDLPKGDDIYKAVNPLSRKLLDDIKEKRIDLHSGRRLK